MKDIKFTTRLHYNFYRIIEHFLGIKMESKALKQSILEEMAVQGRSQKLEIDILYHISPKEFKQNYLKQKKPFVLKGAAKKWGCAKWTPSFFDTQYGEDSISAMSAIPRGKDKNISYEVRNIKLKDYIKDIEQGSSKYYIRFNNFLYTKKELFDQLDIKFLSRLKASLLPLGNILQLFFGAKNSKTNLHAANLHNLFIQFHGEKRWILYPCHYDPMLEPPVKREPYVFSNILPFDSQPEYPIKKYLDYYDITIGPGDILYIPSSMWHYVENRSISIGAAFKWFDPISASLNNFTQNLLVTFSTSPNLLYTFIHRKNLTKLFDFIDKKEMKKKKAPLKT
jgi:ribosomal protein L16 Arg81 hydroxylase